MKKTLSLVIAFVLTISAFAQKISVNELAKVINNSNVVVIDARKSADYMKTHIKGAINLDVTTLCNNSPIEGILKSESELASILGKNGVSQEKKIVVYCETGVRAGRMYWILKYLGAKDVSMLDGQMDAWFKGRKPITKAATTLPATSFTVAKNSSLKVDKAYVKSKLNAAGTVLVDTRKAEDFNAGHIGKAVNIPHESFLNDKAIKSNDAISSLLNGKGVTKDKEVILYCKTSTTAGLAFFIMKSLLDYPNVKVYDGAWGEWNQ
jgi:thiosulfate/3-mercaptopyruvate sulfurtransferase